MISDNDIIIFAEHELAVNLKAPYTVARD